MISSKLTRRSFIAAAAAAAAMPVNARAAEKLGVIASFSVLGDMARQIGGQRVQVSVLVGPNGDAHVFQPSPADAKALAESRLLVLNGLGLEGWMTRLEQASGFKGIAVTASQGVAALEMLPQEGGARPVTDPHAWQSLVNGRIYASNIRDGLIRADPEGESEYAANAAAFVRAMDELEPEIVATISRIPSQRRKIITSHDAFGYFGRAYGVSFIAPAGVSTESEPSARDVAKIIRQIKAQKIPAVFLENITDRRLLDQIARESGAKIGGALYSDALSASDGPAATYLDMFRHNVRTLAAALALPG